MLGRQLTRVRAAKSAFCCRCARLCLCDLAGSERCAKTQNRGERLKEAGNINTSLLILGKCISALRHNQHAKSVTRKDTARSPRLPFRESLCLLREQHGRVCLVRLLQHVPFRESKLTHYLQAFFCGRGKVCMMVNVNQCASTYDETLQVLKFSALAQKVKTHTATFFFFFNH